MDKPILEVKNLSVSFNAFSGTVRAVRNIDLELYKGETLVIVGESGSGKSVTTKAILGILPKNGRIDSGEIIYQGEDMAKYKEKDFWEENRYIRFDTLTQRNTYEIMAVFKISAMSDNGFQYHTYTDMHQERFAEFVSQCKNRSFYDTGITAQHGDKLITLSTCEKGNSNMRIVVVAKKCE